MRQIVESELESRLAEDSALKIEDGCQVVVCDGYLPEIYIQTALGDLAVKIPKVSAPQIQA